MTIHATCGAVGISTVGLRASVRHSLAMRVVCDDLEGGGLPCRRQLQPVAMEDAVGGVGDGWEDGKRVR